MKRKSSARHPGTILIVDESTGDVVLVNVEKIPEEEQFVYIDKDQRTTHDKAQAVRRIPIVEIRMLSLDANNEVVPPHQGTTMYVSAYGKRQRLLRSLTLIR
jgi:hypothetical protein